MGYIKPHGYKVIFNGVVIDWAPRKREAKRLAERYAASKWLPVEDFKIQKVIA